MLCTIQDLGDPEIVNNYGAVNSAEESAMVSKIHVSFTIHVCCIILCCRINVFILFYFSCLITTLNLPKMESQLVILLMVM